VKEEGIKALRNRGIEELRQLGIEAFQKWSCAGIDEVLGGNEPIIMG